MVMSDSAWNSPTRHWQSLRAVVFGMDESWITEVIMDTSSILLAPARELLDKCCYRNELKNSVTASRLGKMLSRKGVDLHYYLYSQSSSEIDRQMHNCMHCHNLVSVIVIWKSRRWAGICPLHFAGTTMPSTRSGISRKASTTTSNRHLHIDLSGHYPEEY